MTHKKDLSASQLTIDKVTNCVTDPKTDSTKIPTMTPEDKSKMDELFNRCFNAGEAISKALKQ